MSFKIKINDKNYNLDINPDTPLLWVLRDHLNLTGTKFGCGVGQCGACTVLLEDEAVRACQTPISMVGDKKITTIETKTDKTVQKLQKFWVQEDVVQCGYCQSGQIMNAASLVKTNSKPNDEEIIKAMDGNICRCGTYNKIKTAIKAATAEV
ncbi:(2Fe-2S)-binding protein [Halarcobacter anaerophilus]|jgi:isoquinoline 1-oxidoreductase alpha subunit|uniref:(2Fe-2S)-binding protein n=1 Tax=Halarcobacter anaerophilus TaxID=877500 RepID=A0A4Q0XY25_9BACT|nr:(2Fe-2S)-binding protein [Halarcobacter anaerophilus]QDF29645.1 aerobic-type carbon monoxide dehydrogenase, small subunit [Halarcobacter anaerophilus]RXJ62570.1 (2Fe-2S)-binding protein [Halarcobacter anaerophilus]